MGGGTGSNTSVEFLKSRVSGGFIRKKQCAHTRSLLASLLSSAEFLGAENAPCLVRKYFTTENDVRDFIWIQNLSLYEYMLHIYLGFASMYIYCEEYMVKD